MMTKNILGMAPPCACPDHPLSGCRAAGTALLPLMVSLARTLAELLKGETYRHGLSPHLRRDVGLPD
ncbi:hypothetical protein GE253_11805 [Niveispirillum sp. SYP-B3756]|uniref:hypothetical protein n=1 Tax=Niveispirillum sp. SYP-B3756 TaxID=2662178 RepID=UPI0012920090|nr:hypothetical protein [Niveispirillum sp. SYP-B3756]MQP66024.1 hypothetical protein [Niveispirillum sp. SYP-B3756]